MKKQTAPLWDEVNDSPVVSGVVLSFSSEDSSLQFLGRKLGISLTFGCSKGVILNRCASVRMENGSGVMLEQGVVVATGFWSWCSCP